MKIRSLCEVCGRRFLLASMPVLCMGQRRVCSYHCLGVRTTQRMTGDAS